MQLSNWIPWRIRQMARDFLSIKSKWNHGLTDEEEFWRVWFDTRGDKWPEEYKSRLDPDRPLQDHIAQCLVDCTKDPVLILDVGAGPLTVIGKKWEARTLEIVAVDALADTYDRLLEKFAVKPLVRTKKCRAEDLLGYFEGRHFDLIYSQNALDHCFDPLKALHQMIQMVRDGGSVLLRHGRNEGENQSYSGLHQWNFDIWEGHLILWNKRHRFVLEEQIAAPYKITASITGNMVLARIHRMG